MRGADPIPGLRALRATDEPREVQLAEADCTEGCCGALYVTIRRDADEVVWGQWRNTGNIYQKFVEVRFDASAYDAELRRATDDQSWEWPARAVARLLDAELRRNDDHFAKWGYKLSGVGTHHERTVVVYFLRPRGGSAPADHWVQSWIKFAVTDRPPAEQVEGFAGLVLAGDPRKLGKEGPLTP